MAAPAPAPTCTDLILHPSVTVVDDLVDTNYGTSCGSSSYDTKQQEFVGLSNQGATCYMNSLLQTLYMTAEFRNTLYKWTYNRERDGDEEYCIPLQLQKLFGMLQLSSSRSVSTEALTKSFGWEGNERFQQQDVQELCRVLFEALEESFKGHPDVENFIDELYAGELVDYIKCMDVDYQSERKDKFLDYSVAILPFGASEPMKSLTECIEHYLEPEILDGDNQYFAESVGRKVDAIKGLKFDKLPKVMSVQMKRFVFDFSGDAIVQKKINDRVTFPLILDMNKYVSKGTISDIRLPEEHDDKARIDCFDEFLKRRIIELKSGKKVTDDEKVDEISMPALVDCNGNILLPDNDESVQNGTQHINNESETFSRDVDPISLIKENGEWVYELYAVLVHSGAISGGHYYVYIRDTSTNKWWNFNDSSVSEVSEKTVLEAQGGFMSSSVYGPVSSAYGSYPPASTSQVENCANAYMLMYRKVLPSNTKIEFPGDDLVPGYIRDEVERITAEAVKREREIQERLNKVTITVHWNSKKYDVATKKNTLYKDFLQQVWNELPIFEDKRELFDYVDDKSDIALHEAVRLRVYNSYHKVAGQPYNMGKSGDKTLDFLRICLNRELTVDVKERQEEWEVYEIDGITIILVEFDNASQAFKTDHKVVRVSKSSTVGDVRNKIIPLTNLDVKNIRIMKLTTLAYAEVKVMELNDDSLQLNHFHISCEGQKLYWEEITTPVANSPAVEAFTTNANQVNLNLQNSREEGNKLTKITVDKRWKVSQLRNFIKQTLQLEEDFRVCKYTPPQLEINGDENKTISNLGVYGGMTIVVKPGPPLPLGHFNFKVYLYNASYRVTGVSTLDAVLPEHITSIVINDEGVESAKMHGEHDDKSRSPIEVESVEENECSFGTQKVSLVPKGKHFEYLFDLLVHGDMLIDEIRTSIFANLKSCGLMTGEDSIHQVRVRLKTGQSCSDILVDSLTLRQSRVALYADRHLAVQILDKKEVLDPLDSSDAIVFVRKWHRPTWAVSPPAEILLKGDMPVNEIATSLAKMFGITPENLKVLVTHPYTVVKLCDLNLSCPSTTCEWVDPTLETRTLSEVKWHLTYGDCIILQDCGEPLKVLTSAEEQSRKQSQTAISTSANYSSAWWDDAVPAKATSGSSTSYVSSSGPQPRVMQQGIVIKTQKAREIEKLKKNVNSNCNDIVDTVELSGDLMSLNLNGSSDNSNVGGCNILFGDVD